MTSTYAPSTPPSQASASRPWTTAVTRQGAITPRGLAAQDDHRALTYAQLEHRAAEISALLAEARVRPGDVVASLFPPSVDLAAALLGIGRLGAVYLPLDPAYPADRLRFMLDDAQPRVLLAAPELAGLARSLTATASLCPPVIHPSDEPADPNGRDLTPSPADVTGIDPAYLIYTSGSTGRPKGVVLTHAGLTNVMEVQRSMFALGHGDRVLQFSSPGYDASIFEVVLALGSGASIQFADRRALLPGPELAALIRSRGITAMVLPPTTLAVLGDEHLGEDLRLVASAGESCPPELARRFASRVAFFNLYGPTETTIWATAFHVPHGAAVRDRVPIGGPIPGVTVHVLDDDGRRVRRGVVGELYVGGVGLAQGYLGQPELTSERFVEGPARSAEPQRLYRTGDLVRERADRLLEYVGRRDLQVKVRGHRVELEEVEAVLAEHPDLAHAAVVIGPEHDGGQHLTAHVIPRDHAVLDPRGLRIFARKRLPESFVPSRVHITSDLPLTAHGKVDRDALRGRVATSPAPAPMAGADDLTVAERDMALAWQRVLGVNGVRAEDRFDELGGHSLAAARVVGELRTRHGLDLPVAALLEHPVLRDAARLITVRSQD